jgi:hypothetical protein
MGLHLEPLASEGLDGVGLGGPFGFPFSARITAGSDEAASGLALFASLLERDFRVTAKGDQLSRVRGSGT